MGMPWWRFFPSPSLLDDHNPCAGAFGGLCKPGAFASMVPSVFCSSTSGAASSFSGTSGRFVGAPCASTLRSGRSNGCKSSNACSEDARPLPTSRRKPTMRRTMCLKNPVPTTRTAMSLTADRIFPSEFSRTWPPRHVAHASFETVRPLQKHRPKSGTSKCSTGEITSTLERHRMVLPTTVTSCDDGRGARGREEKATKSCSPTRYSPALRIAAASTLLPCNIQMHSSNLPRGDSSSPSATSAM
mmetsp:Transcript_1163/g.4790  ORF Transcript_1163/g.4790 Transcript_1163/m.4790 type:complete len:244 (+) Transcript_1163:28-759(+)